MPARTESDALGEMEVPAEAYYGIHTMRSLQNFPISGRRHHARFIEAYALIKKAAAQTNRDLGLLDEGIADAICRACDEVLDQKLRDQFVVDVFQMGAGTSFHMNVNEVLANRAIEILGGEKGDYDRVNPNDHVNMAQSTNDTFPTAMRVSARLLLDELLPVLDGLRDALGAKGQEFDGIVKAGRTHLQDAVPIRLGQEFAAYAQAIAKASARLRQSAEGLEELGLGGSAVGTGINVHPDYSRRAIGLLAEWTGLAFRPAEDLREAMQSQMCIADASAALKLLALELIRISADLRLLSSGPTTGLGEIALPPVQPGSSIMPGKINPSMAEMLGMVCFYVVGSDVAVGMAAQAGQLELNVFMPVMAYCLLDSIEVLKNGVREFVERCIKGIVADGEQCRRYAESTVAMATALNPYVGYAKAAEIAKQAARTGKTIREVAAEQGLLDPDLLDRILDPKPLTEPGLPGEEK
ncbi:MAG: aspartate ammonia-lyase [Armatimonadota bacterium]